MIGKIKMMAIITFYVAVLLVIAVYLQDGSGTFSPGCHKLFLFSFRTYGSSVYGSYPIV